MIGDGMSIPTVTAARVYKGQQSQSTESLSWEKLPYVGLSKVRKLQSTLVISF